MRIVHTADLHLGYKQYGMPERETDFLVAAAYVFSQAKTLNADIINLGGDIFHTLHPSANAVYFLHKLVSEAKDAGIKVVGVDGNHDCTESAWLKVCGVEPLHNWLHEGVYVPTIHNGISLAGINGGSVSQIRADLDTLVSLEPKIDVVCMHLPLAELSGFMSENMMTARDVADKLKPLGVRCVLLGDIHDYKETVFNGIRFIYSGSIEMTALDEDADKTFTVIDITPDDLQTKSYQIPVRPVLREHVGDTTDLDNLLVNIEKATIDPRRCPLVITSYDPTTTGLRKQIESVLQDRSLYRLLPLVNSTNIDVFGHVAEKKDTYERKGAMRNLSEIVADRFGDGSDEFGLIISCIEQPEAVENTLLNFAKNKGLTL